MCIWTFFHRHLLHKHDVSKAQLLSSSGAPEYESSLLSKRRVCVISDDGKMSKYTSVISRKHSTFEWLKFGYEQVDGIIMAKSGTK
jgi:hypothetical protein